MAMMNHNEAALAEAFFNQSHGDAERKSIALRERFGTLMAKDPELAERKAWEAAERLGLSPAEIKSFLAEYQN